VNVPAIQLLKLKYGKPLSIFAFKFNLRRYTMAGERLGLCAIQAAACGKPQEALGHWKGVLALAPDDWAGRCRLTASKPELNGRLVSALETKM